MPRSRALEETFICREISTVPLVKMLSSQRQKLANKIGSLIIHVYNDAKCFTSSAFSWPSRVVAAKLAHEFIYNQPFQPYTPSDFDLQYIRPPVVQELLRTIVSSDLPKLKKETHSCIAASLRFDASMDKTQKDHQYMLLNVVDENGKPDLKFIGIGHVTDPGASGHLAALKLEGDDTVGFDEVMKVITHLSTDGENKNFNVEPCDAEGKKFLKLLTNNDNLLLMCFVADLLFLIKVFQKKLQTGSLLGGWENEFKERYDEEANTFCGIKLWEKERRRPDANVFVTDRRKFNAIRNESVIAINTFVDKRLQVDRNASKSFTPFVKIMATEDEIKEVHRSIAPDLDLANVAIQYQDLQYCAEMQKADPFQHAAKHATRSKGNYYCLIAKVDLNLVYTFVCESL
eukprot:gene8999-16642_t